MDAGLVIREAVGNQVYFSANRAAQIFPELQAIIEKTAGFPDVLRSALAPFASKGGIELAVIYGSGAAGKQSTKSDFDLLVIGDVSLADLVPTLRRAEERLRREVNVSVYPATEFRKKVK